MPTIDQKWKRLFQMWIYFLVQKKWNGKWHNSLAITGALFNKKIQLSCLSVWVVLLMYSINIQEIIQKKI